MTATPPLLVIIGPTASGKSALGVEVAEALDGEIISADAFSVYRGLDIGTDKPDQETRRRIRHHVIDVVEPDQRFSAGDFVAAADVAIADIRRRGRTPIVVGGTHFYVRALLLGLFPSPPRNLTLVSRLNDQWHSDPTRLYARLEAVDAKAASRISPADRQRVVRAIEVFETTGLPMSTHWRHHLQRSRYQALLTAPHHCREILCARIETRVDIIFGSGLVEEVNQILASGVSHDAHALKAIGYRQVVAMFEGRCGLSTAMSQTKVSSRRLAKRQLSWLRHLREGRLQWVPPVEDGGVDHLIALWDGHRRGETR